MIYVTIPVKCFTGIAASICSCTTNGQLILKCLFGVFTFFQKTNENKSTSSKVEFVRSFFRRNVGLKKSFRICLTFTSRYVFLLVFSKIVCNHHECFDVNDLVF